MVTAGGGASRVDEYTLNIGCLPNLVEYRISGDFNDRIDLMVGDPLTNIYQLELEAYSDIDMPGDLDC